MVVGFGTPEFIVLRPTASHCAAALLLCAELWGKDGVLVFDIPPSEVDATENIVKRMTETAGAPDIEFTVLIIVEAKAGTNWVDAH